jgi:methyl-accepting chemotaxis protein
MNIPIHKRILFKITIFVVFASMLPLLINAIYTYSTSKHDLVQALQDNAVITANQLAKSIVTPLWNMDDASATELILSRFQQNEVFAIIVKSPKDSSIMYGAQRDKAWVPELRKKIDPGDCFTSQAPVEKDGKVQGIVHVYFSDKFTKQRLTSLLGNIIINTFILNVVLISVLFVCIQFIVVKPINNVVAGLRDISEGDGDLTKRLTIKSNDEIGSLANYFNNFIVSLQKMISTISEKSKTVKSASEELTSLSNEIRQEGKSVSSRAESITATSNEMSAQMLNIKEAMENANNNVHSVSSSIEEMTATINEISKSAEKSSKTTQNAVQHAKNAVMQIESLKKAAVEIGKVTQTIVDVSDQTNLLAINATIEAASAGEAGKGFAVVASEIKVLSRQTAAATQDIIARVNNIQSATNSMVEYTTSIGSVIDDINSYMRTIATAIEEQSTTANEILKNTVGISTSIKNVTGTVSEASQHSQGITENLGNVNVSVGTLSEKNNSVFTNARALLDLAALLNDLVGRFRV